jgi:hypothetical protein
MMDERGNVGAVTQEFFSTLQGLVGKKCWGFVAGKGTGSVVALDFGEKLKRTRSLKNPHLTQEQRENDAEISLLVRCTWRLDAPERVVCGAWDSNEIDGLMLAGLQEVVGKNVCAATVGAPAWDLALQFDNGLCFKAFCDRLSEEEAEDNYVLYAPRGTFTVAARSCLLAEPKK